MRKIQLSELLHTPLRVVLSLATIIAMVELLIMIIIREIDIPGFIPKGYLDIMDALVLTMIVSPALYFLVFKEMQQSQQAWHDLIEQAADAIFIYDHQGRCISANLTACRALGYSHDELLRFSLHDLIHPDDLLVLSLPDEQVQCKSLLEQKITINGPYRLRRKNGSYISMEIHSKNLAYGQILSVKCNVAERKQMEDQLRLTQFATDHAPDCILWADEQARICYVNQAVCRTHGYTNEELLTMSIMDFTPDLPADTWSTHWDELKKKSTLIFETKHKCKDGSIFPVEVSANFVKFGNKEFNVFYCRDITERKLSESRIQKLAFYDVLTGLPNRRLLEDRLNQAIAACKRDGCWGAVMFLDLDNFKQLNDTHGHKAGDLLLVEVASRLTSCVREVDTIARFGGDEFVVVLSELNKEQSESAAEALIVAEKIRATVAEPYYLSNNSGGTTKMIVNHRSAASIGLVLFNDQFSAERILKRADTAMYQAKVAGRNLIRIYDSANLL